MKGYTIIIPTMWYYPDYLIEMVSRYNAITEIAEILIVNNRKEGELKFTENKVRVLGDGNNQYVNPSWNLGVRESKTDKIILANDDIKIEKVRGLIAYADHFLKVGRVIGVDSTCFKSDTPNWEAKFTNKMNYGFGVFLTINKQSYVPIPKEFKVWYGDTIQFKENTPISIAGCRIVTPMQGTSSKLNLRKERVSELKAFNKYCNERSKAN